MKYAVIAAIVFMWTVLAFLYRLASKKDAARNWVSVTAAFTWFALMFIVTAALGADPRSAPAALFGVGAAGGIFAASVVPLFMAAVGRGNLAVSWTLLTLSFAAAALMSMIYPGTKANAAGVAGLFVAAIAIVLLGWDGAATGAKGGFKRGWGILIALSFITNAGALYVLPLGTAWSGMTTFEDKSAFFLAQTAVFFVLSAALCILQPAGSGRLKGVLIGAAVGVVLFAGNYLSMMALGELKVPAYVLFPSTSGGSTLSVALISALFVGERPGRWGWAGLAVGLLAMVLLGGAA